jgi:hypothetical protein
MIRTLFAMLGILFLVGGCIGLLIAPNTITSHLAILTGVMAAGFSHLFDILERRGDEG